MRFHPLNVWILAWLTLVAAQTRYISIFGHSVSLPFERVQSLLPNFFDFWDSAKVLGDRIKIYTDEKLYEAAAQFPLSASRIDQFKKSMAQVVNISGAFREDIQRVACEGVTPEQISENLSAELEVVLEEFKKEFSLPLPEDHNSRYEERVRMISWIMNKVEDHLVKLLAISSVPEAETRVRFQTIQPHVERVVLVTGQLVDNHPVLVETLLFSGAALLIPEAWFLRPFLSLFGFGPYGPMKGSAATWAQRRFWGAAVAEGSWFARLQAAGMKVIPPGTGKKVAGSIGLGLGIVGSMFRCS